MGLPSGTCARANSFSVICPCVLQTVQYTGRSSVPNRKAASKRGPAWASGNAAFVPKYGLLPKRRLHFWNHCEICGAHPGMNTQSCTMYLLALADSFEPWSRNASGNGDGVLVCEICQGQGIMATKVCQETEIACCCLLLRKRYYTSLVHCSVVLLTPVGIAYRVLLP